MNGSTPPPLPGSRAAASPQAADATPAQAQAPRVSAAAAWLTGLAAFLALTGFCCIGLGAYVVQVGAAQHLEILRTDVGGLRERAARGAAAEALLDEIVQHLESVRATRRSYPPALPEAPPEDPWGTPLHYESEGGDRAWLTSAGPDRRFGTQDDLVRTLVGG